MRGFLETGSLKNNSMKTWSIERYTCLSVWMCASRGELSLGGGLNMAPSGMNIACKSVVTEASAIMTRIKCI